MGKPWSGQVPRSEFFVVRTKQIYGSREILKQSDQFFDRHEVDNGKEIKLPVDDMKLLYDLRAWSFPENYKNSDLKNIVVVIDRNGNYVFRD